MTEPSDDAPGPVARTIAGWIRAMVATRRRSAVVLLLALLIGGVSLAYGASVIRLNTDLRALLPPTAPSVVALDTIESRKGGAEQLVVAVESSDDVQNAAMIDAIGAEVSAWPETQSVTIARDFTPLRNHALYFLDAVQLEDLRKSLTDEHKRAVARVMGPGLTGDPIDVEAVGGDDWDETGGEALDWDAPPPNAPPTGGPPVALNEEFDLDKFLADQRAELLARGELAKDEIDMIWPRENQAGEIVWEEQVGQPYINDEGDVRVLRASLSLPATDVEFTTRVAQRIEAAVADAKARGIGVDTRVEVVAAYNMSKVVDTIQRDAGRATVISGILILAVLAIGFWSVRAVVLVVVPMAVAIGLTVAVAALAYGELNALTAFVFAVLFGMGVDFAVHLYALRQAQGRRADWPDIVARHLRPLTSTMLTTVGSLAVLGLAKFQAFREFGVISAIGVAICFVSALILVPAIDSLLGPLRTAVEPSAVASAPGIRVPKRWLAPLRTARIAALVGLAVVGVVGTPKVEFEKDTRNLDSQSDPSVKKIRYASSGGHCAKTLALIADDPAELDLVVERMRAEQTSVLPGAIDTGEPRKPWVREVFSLRTLMPDDQATKRESIAPIAELTNNFLAELPDLDADARKYQTHLEALERLAKAEPLTVAELPDWAVEPFREKDGRSDRIAHACLDIAGWSIDELIAVRTRLDEMTAGTGVLPADSRLVFADLMVLVEHDARGLPGWALLVILIFIALDLRRVGPTVICFASLALGLALSLGIMGLWPLRLNFYNLVVMPAVVGLGIDASIHLWHARTRQNLAATSKASVLATLTTVAGFSGLLAAENLGLRSIGIVGILALSICVGVAFLALYPLRAHDRE